jgi:hypothetical protein
MSLQIPTGWEHVRDGIPKKGEYILCRSGEVVQAGVNKILVEHILKPAPTGGVKA